MGNKNQKILRIALGLLCIVTAVSAIIFLTRDEVGQTEDTIILNDEQTFSDAEIVYGPITEGSVSVSVEKYENKNAFVVYVDDQEILRKEGYVDIRPENDPDIQFQIFHEPTFSPDKNFITVLSGVWEASIFQVYNLAGEEVHREAVTSYANFTDDEQYFVACGGSEFGGVEYYAKIYSVSDWSLVADLEQYIDDDVIIWDTSCQITDSGVDVDYTYQAELGDNEYVDDSMQLLSLQQGKSDPTLDIVDGQLFEHGGSYPLMTDVNDVEFARRGPDGNTIHLLKSDAISDDQASNGRKSFCSDHSSYTGGAAYALSDIAVYGGPKACGYFNTAGGYLNSGDYFAYLEITGEDIFVLIEDYEGKQLHKIELVDDAPFQKALAGKSAMWLKIFNDNQENQYLYPNKDILLNKNQLLLAFGPVVITINIETNQQIGIHYFDSDEYKILAHRLNFNQIADDLVYVYSTYEFGTYYPVASIQIADTVSKVVSLSDDDTAIAYTWLMRAFDVQPYTWDADARLLSLKTLQTESLKYADGDITDTEALEEELLNENSKYQDVYCVDTEPFYGCHALIGINQITYTLPVLQHEDTSRSYSNEQYGFSLEYPSSYILREYDLDQKSWLNSNNTIKAIQFFKDNDMAFIMLPEGQVDHDVYTDQELESVYIDGKKLLRKLADNRLYYYFDSYPTIDNPFRIESSNLDNKADIDQIIASIIWEE